MNDIGGGEELEEDWREMGKVEEKEKEKNVVLMWGYLPGVSPERSPLLHPVPVRRPESATGDSWRDVSGGGCGFAMAISESGKLITWGSTDDMGQSYLTAGKHEEIPEAFPLPAEAEIVKAAAGWAHCVAITACGEVFTWGWKECVPTGRVIGGLSFVGSLEKDERQNAFLNEEVSPTSHGSRPSSGTIANYEGKGSEESLKRRRLSSAKQGPESSSPGDETLSTLPCLVTLGAGVKITAVAAGGRHTLALADVGQVWGWGYGGEGQLGLGSRMRMVSSPHLVPCFESASYVKDIASASCKGNTSSEAHAYRVIGSSVKAIACGGRHSAVVTGMLLLTMPLMFVSLNEIVVQFLHLAGDYMDRYSRKDGDKASILLKMSAEMGPQMMNSVQNVCLLSWASGFKELLLVYGTHCAFQLMVESMHLVEISLDN